jgi:hypothetical protein
VSVAAMAARRAATGTQIRVYKFSRGRQGPALQHFGSQPAYRRSHSLFLQRNHRRTVEPPVLDLVRLRLRYRSSWRQSDTISRVSHCSLCVCVCFNCICALFVCEFGLILLEGSRRKRGIRQGCRNRKIRF